KFDPLDPIIPDGSLLYTCTVHIAAAAPAPRSFPLTCSNPNAFAPTTPTPTELLTECPNGEISVMAPPATDTPTAAPAPPGGDGDGCAVADRTQGGLVWFLLLPALMRCWRLRQRFRPISRR